MSYVALYRKFRPTTFDDVKGQDHIVTTLKNEVKNNRIGHAYLFCGTRGTGKTTIAKILAKAVNCENPQDGSPCNECKTCRAINDQASLSVVEIDAASNNGVANVRDIIEEVKYAPTSGKYRVYIIDEVHMLSNGAFNALLKTLEEPPAYVIFILATTEVHKIPITILSRCQRYDFRRISIDTISDRILELTAVENVKIEEGASRYIAKAADGSMRDALSLLDQCIAFYPNEELTFDKVLNVLGAVDSKVYEDMFKALCANNFGRCVELLEDVLNYGRDLGQFITELIWHIRNVLILKTVNGNENLLNLSEEALKEIREETSLADEDQLIRYIKILSKLSADLKYSAQKRVITEICFVKLCSPQMDSEQDISTVSLRLKNLEKKVDDGEFLTKEAIEKIKASGIPSGGEVKNSASAENDAEKIEHRKQLAEALPEDIKEVIRNWNKVIDACDFPDKSYIDKVKKNVTPDGELNLIFSNSMAYKHFKENEEAAARFEELVSKCTNKQVKIVYTFDKDEFESDATFDFGDVINMPVTISD
ncbi:MAG: DNA polymerase III subunit gamma/tau [Lachnospiraceae bacterium]|nr:DNA polymerase III subunit gamma/tau [Lachnospiraceae bacterium]